MDRKKAYGAVLLVITMISSGAAIAYNKAFHRTDVGEIEVRTLPPARWLATEMDGRYFDQSSGLFTRLFDYIKVNDVAMTVPVEGSFDEAQMRFYLGSDAPSGLTDTDTVAVVDVPARQVVSAGGRGSYSETNLTELKDKLNVWLDQQLDWEPTGPAYAVYWNGPFTPWFLKRFEVHVPVQPAKDY